MFRCFLQRRDFTENKENTVPLLQVRSLNAGYVGKAVLKDVDFALEPGDFVCLSGLNGCGKSTLLSILAGVTLADLTYTGQVLVDGKPIKKIPKKEVARQIGFLSQKEYSVWNFSVLETIVTGRYCYTGLSGTYSEQDYHIAREAAALLQIENLLDRNIHSLSGGEYQRVRIARTFAQEPQTVLLDEPASGLDFTLQYDLLQIVKELAAKKNMAVLLSIHDINTAAVFADTMALMAPLQPCQDKTLLITGKPWDVVTEENLFLTYGRKFEVCPHPKYGCPFIYLND
ncbi:MAG: ABC transporter ATP-binding protein [Candidatus Treponema excrementipullorum]|nr:ABC transporter ATP-binding protein [Candidatus Treponema excrementipullorum]MDY4707323.1 ABC transporter ATP-binding protein [Candidatus Treponema excrementipullorum]